MYISCSAKIGNTSSKSKRGNKSGDCSVAELRGRVEAANIYRPCAADQPDGEVATIKSQRLCNKCMRIIVPTKNIHDFSFLLHFLSRTKIRETGLGMAS